MKIKKHYASFSEAIREGAKLRPQVYHRMTDRSGTCALGAGYEAVYRSLHGMDCTPLEFLYSYLKNAGACPVPHCRAAVKTHGVEADAPPSIADLIVHLNDDHKWTREAIADWLEKEEEKIGYVTVIDNEKPFSTQNVGSEVLALT